MIAEGYARGNSVALDECLDLITPKLTEYYKIWPVRL